MSFENNIKRWVQIDNQIKVYNDKIKQLRDEKANITEELLGQAEENNYKDAVIQITDGKLKFNTSKVQSPLTFKYVEEILSNTIKEPAAIEAIIKRLKDNRETKYVQEIKRYTNEKSK
jgi:hypothetical protein